MPKKKPANNRSDKAGFTLLEVLLAFAILAMLLSMAYTILISTLKASERIHTMSEAERAASRLLGLIGRDIEAAYMYQLESSCFMGKKTSPDTSRLDFVCNTDSLLFSGDLRSDLCEVSYFVRPNTAEPGLFCLLRREEFFLDTDLTAGGYSVRMFDRVLQFQLRFFNAQGSDSFTWDSGQQGGLPIGVEITLKLPLSPPGTSQEILYKNARTFRICVPIAVSAKSPQKPKEGGS
jgi:type II secretion system protein J